MESAAIMSAFMTSLVALTNAQLENLALPTLPTLPTLKPLHHLPGLPALPTLPPLPALPSLVELPKSIQVLPHLQKIQTNEVEAKETIPCTCGVFLSGQFKRGSQQQPTGNAALLQELMESYQCNAVGEKQCITKCLDTMVRHLPNSQPMICGSIDRDCVKERAYLFVKNCKDRWINSNLSAGREYCCKDGFPYQCPNSI